MDHTETKSELNKRRLAKTALEKNISSVKTAIDDLLNKKSAIELSVPSRKQDRKEKAREEVLALSSRDLECEIAEYERELSELNKEKKTQLDHFSLDRIKLNFFKNSPLSEDVLENINDLRSEAADTVSKRFIEAYFVSLGKCRVSEEDFLEALENLDQAEKRFFDHRSEKPNILVNKLTDKLKSIDIYSEGKGESSSGVVMGIGVVVLLLSLVLFPVYSLLLGVVTFFNIRESVSMKYSLDFLKVVEDNFNLMEKALTVRAVNEYQLKQDEINMQYAEAMAIIRQDIDEVNREISDVRQKTLAEFVFDASEIEREISGELSNIEHQIKEQRGVERDLLDKLAVVNKEIAEYSRLYQNSLDSLEKQYINYDRVGENKLYPSSFLLDVGDPPIMFKNPNRSFVFIYKDKESIIDFIKLVSIQLRCNMHPTSSNIELWDSEESGIQFMSFRDNSSLSDDNGFKILNTSDGIKDSVNSLELIMQKRLKVIRVSYDNIEGYNSDMLKLNSVTENFYTVFALSCENLLSNEKFKRLLVTGPELGIYMYSFVDVRNVNENWIPVLEKAGACVIAQNGKVAPNAVDAIISKIKAQRNSK